MSRAYDHGSMTSDLAETRKYRLALAIIFVYAGLALFWSWHPPDLPGDVTGGVFSALSILLGAIGNHFFKVLDSKENSNGGK